MKSLMGHMFNQVCRVICVLGLVCVMMCVFTSCHWHEAKEVITLADSIDKTEHVIYGDTAVLGKTIRTLDNPFGRVLMPNTLGKAYYYMGRNYSLSNQIAEAAECYIEADRLKIDDPIYRGRVNSCMGYICAQNNNDSLALIFYERASENFKESSNDWYYAQSLLNMSYYHILLHQFVKTDNLLQIAQSYPFDSAYQARYYETKGLYFYEQQLYDSALVYFNQGLNYWQSEDEKCFSYLKIMQAYYHCDTQEMDSAIYYAYKLISSSSNPNYISNAYYALMLDAKEKNSAQLLSRYSHERADAQRKLSDSMLKYAEPLPTLKEYVSNPHPWRWGWIIIWSVIFIYLLSIVGTLIYRKRHRIVQQSLDFENKRLEVLDKYHVPHKRWRKYSLLNRDIDPWLHDWLYALDALLLSEQEKIFCAISLIYPHMTDVEIADFMCYSKDGIRVFKNRILKKLGLSSIDFPDFLRNLSIPK